MLSKAVAHIRGITCEDSKLDLDRQVEGRIDGSALDRNAGRVMA